MRLLEIQQAVDVLPVAERLQLTAWMVARYPLLTVEQLMAHASSLIDRGEWVPSPPTEDTRLTPAGLEHASRIAKQLDLGQ